VHEHLYDCAKSAETAIALMPPAGSKSSFFDDQFDAQEAVRDVFRKKICGGVRFSDSETGITFHVSAQPAIKVHSTVETGKIGAGTQAAEGKENTSKSLQPRSKLEFYGDDSNLWMIKMQIARVGNKDVHIGFRLESIQVLWDLTRTESLRGLLHAEGAADALIMVFNEMCPKLAGQTEGKMLQALDISATQWLEQEQMRSLALLSLVNLLSCGANGQHRLSEDQQASLAKQNVNLNTVASQVVNCIVGVPAELLERIVDLCARLMTSCGMRGLYSLDQVVGGAVGASLSPLNLAKEAKSFLRHVCVHLSKYFTMTQRCSDAEAAAVLPKGVPSNKQDRDALHMKLEVLLRYTVPEAAPQPQAPSFIKSTRIVVC
jgi:hypothetical protein